MRKKAIVESLMGGYIMKVSRKKNMETRHVELYADTYDQFS
jgi:hypothetical protein